MELILQIGVIFCTFLVLIYLYAREKLLYFSKRGIPYVKAKTFLGNTWKALLFRENVVESFNSIYGERKREDRLLGFFHGLLPMIMVADPDLAEQVFIKDFTHFYDRGIRVDDELNPLDGHLVNLKGAKWRTIRNKLSPTFTSGKLRGMLPLMDSCVDDFLKVLETDKSQEMKSIFGRLSLHVIGSCTFGIESDVLTKEDSAFLFYCEKISHPGLSIFLRMVLSYFIPCLRLKTWPDDMNRFFFDLVQQGFELRRNKDYVRNDFLQLLWELKERGEVKKDKYEAEREDEDDTEPLLDDKNKNDCKIVLSDAVLTAQAVVFLAGGYETTSTSLAFLSYFLSKNKAAQQRAREEARKIKDKHGSFNNEALKDLVYIEACMNESLRLHPPIGALARECTKSVNLGGYHIEKGTAIFVPIMAIQRDPEYFPDPDSFRPERFLETEPRPFTFLPFGAGPRICIGQRFAVMEMKLAIAKLLCQFSIEPSPIMASFEPIRMEPVAIMSVPKDGIHCILKSL